MTLANSSNAEFEAESNNMATPSNQNRHCEIILGNSNRRFSGVTSTMLQTLTVQQRIVNIRVLGSHHLPDELKHLSISFLKLARLCSTKMQDGRYRVFHARRNNEMIQALLLKYIFRAKIKIVFTSTAQRHHSRFTRFLMDKMDCILSTCTAAASYLQTPPYQIIPHGISTELYKPDANKRPANAIKIGMFGRVRKQKGTHLFVNACIDTLPRHPNVSAIIVGSITPENQEWVSKLEKKIEIAGLADRIIFKGEQAFEQLPALFQSVSLVAALSENEGFGLTVLEALSSGAAVLATEAGAWPDIIVNGQHGYVVPTNNQKLVTEQLETLLSSPSELQKMGKQGRELVEKNFKIETEAEHLCKVYRTLQQVL